MCGRLLAGRVSWTSLKASASGTGRSQRRPPAQCPEAARLGVCFCHAAKSESGGGQTPMRSPIVVRALLVLGAACPQRVVPWPYEEGDRVRRGLGGRDPVPGDLNPRRCSLG